MHTLFHADDLDVKIAYDLAGIFSPRRPVSGKRCVEAARLIREKYPSVVALPALVAACELAANMLHRLANGQGTVAGLTLGEAKRLAREIRDRLEAALALAKEEVR